MTAIGGDTDVVANAKNRYTYKYYKTSTSVVVSLTYYLNRNRETGFFKY